MAACGPRFRWTFSRTVNPVNFVNFRRAQPGRLPVPGGGFSLGRMAHEKRIVTCTGPHDPHALDGIPLAARTGDLDRACPLCRGHGQWNVEFDLASQRSKRCICGKCDGRGWIETGDDPVPSPDIELSGDGHPRWVIRYAPSDDRE